MESLGQRCGFGEENRLPSDEVFIDRAGVRTETFDNWGVEKRK